MCPALLRPLHLLLHGLLRVIGAQLLCHAVALPRATGQLGLGCRLLPGACSREEAPEWQKPGYLGSRPWLFGAARSRAAHVDNLCDYFLTGLSVASQEQLRSALPDLRPWCACRKPSFVSWRHVLKNERRPLLRGYWDQGARLFVTHRGLGAHHAFARVHPE